VGASERRDEAFVTLSLSLTCLLSLNFFVFENFSDLEIFRGKISFDPRKSLISDH
jgi:hypothetical protein